MSRTAFEQLELRPGEHVLEVGFGGGELSSLLIAAGAEVTGVDISGAMVARARSRFSQAVLDGRARFASGSAETLPLPRVSIDKAASVNTVYFWPDLDRVTAEFARVLKPGGMLLLCFQTAQAVRRWPGHRHGFIAYGVDEVSASMVRAGFHLAPLVTGSDRQVGDYVCLKGVQG